jgi:type III pantothenate kinase
MKFGAPCVVVSLGTATTLDVVNSKRKYLGGLIAPGMRVNAKALAIAASKLPEVALSKPDYLIAQTTETAIRSGIVNGQIAMIEGLVQRAIAELGETPTVVATGGFAEMIAPEIKIIDVFDPDLTLDGLRFAAAKV